MKSKTATKPTLTAQAPADTQAITRYADSQNAAQAAVCRALRTEIEAALPKATSKIYHGSPVWFVGENPVVGYNVTAKKGVNLLFWNGQSFGEPTLEASGKFSAAQIQYTDVVQIDSPALRRWLKRAGTDIRDYRGYFLAQKSRQKKA